MTQMTPKLRIVEHAYADIGDSSTWLAELGTSIRQIVPSLVTCFAFEIARIDGRMCLGRTWTEDPVIERQLQLTFAEAPSELLDLFYGAPLVAKMSREVLEHAGVAFESTVLAETYGASGFVDAFGVSAIGPSGRGAVLGMGLADPAGPAAEERIDWVHIAAHIAAASRLRDRLAGGDVLEHADAILRPDGIVEHTTVPDIVELLSSAVGRIEQARSGRSSSREALELWRGLVAGEWSLVEHFEDDGRRYYVAVRNPPDAVRSRALTRREAEVAAYIATGATTPATAYALGVEPVTVRSYLGTAMQKLGVRSRAELISLRSMLLDQDNKT